MTAFASADDFATRLGLTLTEDEQTRADALLDQASRDIRDEYEQAIDLVENDVLAIPGTTDERLLLPQRPVVSVASVELDGVALSGWHLAGNALVRCGGFGRESRQLQIVYTHGFGEGEIPARLKSIAIEMVVRVWVNPSSLIQENVGPVQTTFAPYSDPPRGLQLTDSERRSLRRLFGSRSGSVWMGG